MSWIWVSTIAVLFGAELNSEIEHQTAVDTTTGAGRALGPWVRGGARDGRHARVRATGQGGQGCNAPRRPLRRLGLRRRLRPLLWRAKVVF